MPHTKSQFILDEAEHDDNDSQSESDVEPEGNGEIWYEDEIWQDEDQENPHDEPLAVRSLPVEGYRNPHIQNIHALAEDLEKRYVQASPESARISTDVDNSLTDHDLRLLLLGSSAPSHIYCLRCKRGQETSLVMEIARYLLIPGADEPKTQELYPIPPSSTEQSRAARGWQVVKQFTLGTIHTLPETEFQLQSLFGEEYDPSQWQVLLRKINDKEDDEETPSICAEIDKRLASLNSPAPPYASSSSSQLSSSQSPQHWTQSHVYSAFTLPSTLGWVYLEARVGQDLLSWLRQRLDVVHSHDGDIVLETISEVEVGQMLAASPTSVEPHTWVRVTRGLYRNDVGLVLAREISSGSRRLKVLLVPRLKSTVKCKSLPPSQVLFNPTIHSHDHYKVIGQEKYQFQGQVYDHGLVEVILDYSSVSYTDVDPDMTTHLLFLQSEHVLCRKYPIPAPKTWSFFPQERVKAHVVAPLLGNDWEWKDAHHRKTYEKTG
ncbi:transcription elongation factor spt5 [Stygiomarasmius scandens]|uniref:Transcription elongation factor spt5 n=1 Tax=Marasmiellus scandens TaxID=2682957 RepID=A0ABR1JDU1_9AGAR